MPALLRNYTPAILSGLLMFWAFPRFHWFFLAWVGLVPLIYVSAAAPPWLTARRFFVAGWLFHTLVLQWLAANIYWAGGWAVLGQQGLVILLSLFWGFVGFAWAVARRRNGKLAGALLFALLWTGLEWCHANLLTGFGWCALGYSQGPDLYLLQWAAVGGVPLISFFLVLFNALVALCIAEPGRALLPRLGSAAALLLLTHALGYLLVDSPPEGTPQFNAGMVQGNFSQQMRWDPAYTEEIVASSASMSQQLVARNKVDLFVWPEAQVVRHYETPALLDRMRELTIYNDAPLFTGAVREEAGKYYNSSVLIDAQGEIAGHYDKVHLVPFGEYLPLAAMLPFLRGIVMGDVDPGFDQKVLALNSEVKIGPLICFEMLHAGMSEHLRKMDADMLVVVTNLGWFGQSNAVSQELEIARVRAVETRLPLIHAANTGISGVFDPWGRFTPIGHHVPDIAANPNLLTQRRFAGVVPVPVPGPRPVPYGTVLFPWLAPLAGLLLLVFAIVSRDTSVIDGVEIADEMPVFEGLDRRDEDFIPDLTGENRFE